MKGMPGTKKQDLKPCFKVNRVIYTRHTSSCICVGYVRSPESLT
ncbi:hypothetical protein SB6421_04924 [Klebsiella huaxiensis]|nr:hypothetical protein SB6421_04924 [Klebsiella huaxiensis]